MYDMDQQPPKSGDELDGCTAFIIWVVVLMLLVGVQWIFH